MTISARFLCIGDIDVDLLIGVDRLPTRDGKVNGEHLRRVPGGMAANVSVALARFGAAVRILGRVGEDDEGVFALHELGRAGVETEFIAQLRGVRTFSCLGLITPDGEKSLIKLMTPAYRPIAAELTPQVCAGVTHMHLTSAGDPALCQRVVERERTGGATTSLDVEHAECPDDSDALGAATSLDVERADCPDDPGALDAAIAGFDILFCNAEARAFLDQRLERPLATVTPTIVTTLGEDGARIETDGRSVEARGFAADVVDTTGAGDCFAAAFLHARLVQRLDWPETLGFANRAAALSTQGFGAQSALPTLEEVAAALAV